MKNFLLVSFLFLLFFVNILHANGQNSLQFVTNVALQLDNESTAKNVDEWTAASYKKNPNKSFGQKIANHGLVATEFCTSLQFKFAQLLNRNVETITNIPLFSFIDEWWATRYRYGGTSKKGIDCSSYTGHLLLAVFGITLPRTAREQYAASIHINRDDLKEGDLVFFNTIGGISHVGVYLGDGYFTHSSCSRGVTISNLEEKYYSKKFIGGRRVITSTNNDYSN